MKLKDKVSDQLMRLSGADPRDVARTLLLQVVSSEPVNFRGAATKLESILKEIQTDKPDILNPTDNKILAEVEDFKRGMDQFNLSASGQKPESPDVPETETEPLTCFGKEVILPFQVRHNRAYLLSDFAEHLDKKGIKLKDINDGFFGLSGVFETALGDTGVVIYRIPLINSFGFTVRSSDSRAGHLAIKCFECVFLQQAQLLFKEKADTQWIYAMFGGKPKDHYEFEVRTDTAKRVIPYRSIERFR